MNNVPKTVLMTSHMAEFKGSAMCLFLLALGLDRALFRPVVFFAKKGPLVEKLNEQGVEAKHVSYIGIAKLFTYIRFYFYLRFNDVDLVYVNCAVGYSRIAAKVAKRLGIPVLWHVHEPPFGSRVQKNLPWMTRLADLVVVVSEELRATICPFVKSVVNVPNGVDLVRFNPTVSGSVVRDEYGIPPSAFVFGCVGSVEERKNTLRFVEAAIEVAQQYEQTYFMVVGGGDDNYVQGIMNLVNDRGLKNRIIFTGPQWNMPAIMASVDVVLMPSDWEGFPRVVIESMAVGTPVIASKVGDVTAVITHNGDGIVMDSWQLGDVIRMMSWSIKHKTVLKGYGIAATQSIAARFSQQQHVERMQLLFDDVLSCSKTQ